MTVNHTQVADLDETGPEVDEAIRDSRPYNTDMNSQVVVREYDSAK